MKDSSHLKEVFEVKKGAINLQVVFSDIVDYSKRKSTVQKRVIDNFTKLSQNALESVSKEYTQYAQNNNINFATDILKIPTGDGLAVIFPFEGIQSIHLDFARLHLEEVHKHNKTNGCERFKEQGWCNCHDNFNLRIGLAEGKGIIYKDINGNYNVAGNVINIASRIMQLGNSNSIMLTEEAYKNLIDMTSDTLLEDDFASFKEITVKHGLKMDVFQYKPELDYINSEIPNTIAEQISFKEFREKASTFMPIPMEDEDFSQTIQRMGESFGKLGQAFKTLETQKQFKVIKQNEGEIKK